MPVSLYKANIALLPLFREHQEKKSLRRPRTTDAAAAADNETEEGGSGPVYLPSSKYRENTSLPLTQ